MYNVNRGKGAKWQTARDCALKFEKPRLVKPKEKTAEEFRAEFDAHKQLLIAIANN